MGETRDQRWIACRKELPGGFNGCQSRRVLVFCPGHRSEWHDGTYFAVYMRGIDREGWYIENTHGPWKGITHWMSVPGAPTRARAL